MAADNQSALFAATCARSFVRESQPHGGRQRTTKQLSIIIRRRKRKIHHALNRSRCRVTSTRPCAGNILRCRRAQGLARHTEQHRIETTLKGHAYHPRPKTANMPRQTTSSSAPMPSGARRLRRRHHNTLRLRASKVGRLKHHAENSVAVNARSVTCQAARNAIPILDSDRGG